MARLERWMRRTTRWGCNYGAGANGAGCSITTNDVFNNGSGTVDADPWIVWA